MRVLRPSATAFTSRSMRRFHASWDASTEEGVVEIGSGREERERRRPSEAEGREEGLRESVPNGRGRGVAMSRCETSNRTGRRFV